MQRTHLRDVIAGVGLLAIQGTRDARSRDTLLTVVLCFFAAALEGFVFQSVGVAAGRLAREFHLSAAAMGWVAGASTIALLPGAIVGGELADRIGRKRVLATAVTIFGVFTLAMTAVRGLGGLVAMRFLAGLGLGAALPNLIALSAEVGDERSRSRFIGMMYCGVPAGGAIASLISIAGDATADWRLIFYAGGALALLVAPAMFWALPESRQFEVRARSATPPPTATHRGAARTWQVLFFEGRTPTTLLLWVALFVEMLLIYVLVNWLPVLLVSKGFSPLQAGEIQIVFNLGGMAGNLLFGWLMDRSSRSATALIMYGCVIIALAAMAIVHGYVATAVTATGVGLFVIGGQMVLYAMVPIYYPTMMRSTGVGWSVAIGRVGSFAGPILAGQLLQSGVSATQMLSGTAPVLAVAAVAVVLLLRRPTAGD